jgi:hypothetical protein
MQSSGPLRYAIVVDGMNVHDIVAQLTSWQIRGCGSLEGKMDDFWWGVVITLIVGIPGAYIMSVLAHMHTPRFVQFLERRRLLKSHKTKKQALRVFNRIKSFHDGKTDRYASYILFASGAIVCAIFASMLLLMTSIHSYEFPISVEYAIVLLLAIIAILFVLIFLSSIYETSRQLARFDDYKAEFEKRWGSTDEAGS